MEILDAYFRDGTLAGCDLIRGEKIPQGFYKAVSEVIVKHKDSCFLLIQRDYNKVHFPAFYEAGAGGAVQKGENPYQAALRELKEETGIMADELIPIYEYISEEYQSIYYGFLYKTEYNKNSIVLQDGETISYLWLNKNDFLEFIDSEKYVPVHRERIKNILDKIL